MSAENKLGGRFETLKPQNICYHCFKHLSECAFCLCVIVDQNLTLVTAVRWAISAELVSLVLSSMLCTISCDFLSCSSSSLFLYVPFSKTQDNTTLHSTCEQSACKAKCTSNQEPLQQTGFSPSIGVTFYERAVLLGLDIMMAHPARWVEQTVKTQQVAVSKIKCRMPFRPMSGGANIPVQQK